MSYDFKVKKTGSEMNEGLKQKETVEEVLKYKFLANEERKISKETCEYFGVRAAVSEVDGKTPTAFYFPSYNAKGEITGFTKQDLTKKKTEKFHWSCIGDVSISNKLFGQHQAEKIERKKVNFTVTEGQWDSLSVFQSQVHSVKGTKYEGHLPFVVSIPMGTANAVESLLHNKGFVNSFDSMTVFFDNDEATPAELKRGVMKGKEAREAVSSAFLGSIELWCITPTNGMKDASDFLQDKENQFGSFEKAQTALAKLVQFDRQRMVTEKIAHVGDIEFESVIKPLELGVQVDCFPKLNEMLGGFRKRELTIVTSSSGAGKTTSLSKINDDILAQGYKSGMIYLEETNVKTLQRAIASKLKVSYKEYKRNPLAVATEEAIKAVYDELKAKDNIIFIDHFGSMPIMELMAKIRHMYFVEKCDYILLDHLSMVISGTAVKDERKELDIVMTELAAFCASHDVGIILVVHMNRQGSTVQAPKGKENEPFWARIDLNALRGSGGLEQLTWNVLSLEREYLPNRKRGRVRWCILKNREFGELGIADVFDLNEKDWSIKLYDDDTTENDAVVNLNEEEDPDKLRF